MAALVNDDRHHDLAASLGALSNGPGFRQGRCRCAEGGGSAEFPTNGRNLGPNEILSGSALPDLRI